MLFALLMQLSFAQDRAITGKVTSSDDGLPLPGVNVIVKGTSRGVQTDFDGNYSIRAKSGETLVFSYVGAIPKEIPLGASDVIDVTLSFDNQLQEIVIDSYRTTAKEKSTVASSTITSESVVNRPNASIVQTLTGQVAGLDISTFSGQPGANSTVQLRGINSINGNTEPLFLMDGIPINEDNFRSLNPNEIESITVLKDAGATAIYGSRGANGVVVIKTKTGSVGSGLKVGYTGILSFSTLQNENYDLLNSRDYLRLERDFGTGRGAGDSDYLFDGTGEPFTDSQIANSPDTDWLDYFFRTALTKNHTVNISTGGQNASSYTSLGYFDQDGILKNSSLQRFNFRNNISGSSKNDKFNYSTTLSVNYSKNDVPTSIGTNGVNQNPLFGAYSSLPYLRPEDNPGSRILASNFVLSSAPFYIMDKLSTSESLNEEVKIIAGFSANYELAKNLIVGFNAGGDYQNEIDLDSQEPISRNQLRFNPAVDGTQSQGTVREFSFNSTTSLNYTQELGLHTIGMGAYLEYFKAHLRTFGYTQNGLNPKTFAPGDGSGFIADGPDDDFRVPTVGANKLDAGLLSYFGTFNYDYDSKYGLSATVRRDASYRFASTNRWGTFYSLGARWNISNEDFMDGSVFNTLKLRGSYGKTGNQRITGNSYFSGADLPFSFYATGQGYAGNPAIFLSQIGNTTLKWETVTQANIGIDFGVFNNRLRGAFDYYKKKTEDLFQNRPVSGINSTFAINANIGSLYNEGFDVELHYDVFRNQNVNLTLNFVANYNKNELADLPSDDGEIIGIGRNGGPINEIYAVPYLGVNPANGNLLFLTADGNVTENPNVDTDRVWTNRNANPDYQGSYGFNFDYKGFFLTTQLDFVIGLDRFDFDYAGFIDRDNIGDFNLSGDIFRAWTVDNRVTDIPSLTATNLANDTNSDRFLRDADYMRLRFLNFGYNFPLRYLDNTGIESLKIFANAENLFTLTKFRGFDPAARAGSRSYPTPRILSFGVEIGL